MIRLLIDENLPSSMGAILPVPCTHARDYGDRPTDLELWKIARERHLVILTRDTDFFDRLMLEGPPPKVIWVRLGNIRRRDLEKALADLWPTLAALLGTADLIEIHPGAVETFSHPDAGRL